MKKLAASALSNTICKLHVFAKTWFLYSHNCYTQMLLYVMYIFFQDLAIFFFHLLLILLLVHLLALFILQHNNLDGALHNL